MPDVSPGAFAAAQYVREHPGLMQSRTIRAIMGDGSYGRAWQVVKEARDAGLIKTIKDGSRLFLYPPEAS